MNAATCVLRNTDALLSMVLIFSAVVALASVALSVSIFNLFTTNE